MCFLTNQNGQNSVGSGQGCRVLLGRWGRCLAFASLNNHRRRSSGRYLSLEAVLNTATDHLPNRAGISMNDSEGIRFRRLNRPQVITEELPERRHKGSSTYSGKVFKVILLSLGGFLLLPLLVIILILESPIQPEVFRLKEPPPMRGCWESNLKLREAQRLFENQIIGPESIANIGDVLFSGTADGKIVKLSGRRIVTVTRLGKEPCGSTADEPSCGRPLGIRVGPNGTLFVADAYLGLFEVSPTTGEATRLVAGGQVVAGRKLSFINDVTVTQDGKKVYFTDSSSRWQRRDYMHLIMEATADGRVLEYDTETKELTVIMENLRFPNGIQLLPDEESVLVAETTMARIRRCPRESKPPTVSRPSGAKPWSL